MFSKSKQSPETAPATPQRNYNNVRNSSGHTFSVIASDVEIVGNLTARVDLHVDGKVQGDVTCGNLVQGEGSIIAGKVRYLFTIRDAKRPYTRADQSPFHAT